MSKNFYNLFLLISRLVALIFRFFIVLLFKVVLVLKRCFYFFMQARYLGLKSVWKGYLVTFYISWQL